MSIKTLIAAAAIAVMPMVATAAPVIFDNGTTTIAAGESDTSTFVFIADGGAEDFRHTYELAVAGTGEALVTVNLTTISQFEGLVAQWLNAADDSVISSVAITDQITTLSTTFADPGSLNQVLSISWTNAVKGTGFDGEVTVSTVPVPAGLLLMGTALAGLGMTRRKATKA